MSIAEAKERYRSDQPLFAAARTVLLQHLEAVRASEKVPCRIEARVKEEHSFLLKMVKKQKSYEEVRDPVGGRMVVIYPDDRGRVVDSVIARIGGTVDDKSAQRAPDQLGYMGVHIDTSIDTGGKRVPCEIQIHTAGESLWANSSHDLLYKFTSGQSADTKRALYRTAALTELFDLQVADVRAKQKEDGVAWQNDLVESLNREFLAFSTGYWDAELTDMVIRELVAELTEEDIPQLNSFVSRSQSEFAKAYATPANPLFRQPESLLLAWLGTSRPMLLENVWPEWLPDGWREDFQTFKAAGPEGE